MSLSLSCRLYHIPGTCSLFSHSTCTYTHPQCFLNLLPELGSWVWWEKTVYMHNTGKQNAFLLHWSHRQSEQYQYLFIIQKNTFPQLFMHIISIFYMKHARSSPASLDRKHWMSHLLCFLVILDSNLINSLIVHVKCSVCSPRR